MLLHYLKNKENKDKKFARSLYDITIKKSLHIINKELNVKKEFDISFELTSLLLISILIGSSNKTRKGEESFRDSLVYIFIDDLDHSFRTIGIYDMKIGKYVKKYTKKFYFRIPILENIFIAQDIHLFEDYLYKFKIIDKLEVNSFVKNLYKDLNILIKRAKSIKNTKSVYKDLFK